MRTPSTDRPMPHAVRCGPLGSGGSPSKGPLWGRGRPRVRTSGGAPGRGMPRVRQCGPPETVTEVRRARASALPMFRAVRKAMRSRCPERCPHPVRTRIGQAWKRTRPRRASRARRPNPVLRHPLRGPAVPVRALGTRRVRRCARPWRSGGGPTRMQGSREAGAPVLRAGPRQRPIPEPGTDADGTRAATTSGSEEANRPAGRCGPPTVCGSVTCRACSPVPS